MREFLSSLILAAIGIVLIVLGLLLITTASVSAYDAPLAWDAATGVTGYKVYASTDVGLTWSAPRDAGNKTTFTWLGASDTGLTLFRVSSYNAQGEAIRTEAGAWCNPAWVVPIAAKGLGIH
jgi:hypothetical protein